MSTAQEIHPSRVPNIPSDRKKRKKFKPPKPQPASTSLTRGQLRKKIRDITRLLQASASKDGSGAPANHKPAKLSATARLDHERALAAYKHELSTQQLSSKRDALEKRYHKVRFFERRKATRALSRLKRRLAVVEAGGGAPADDDDNEEEEEEGKEELERKIHEAEVDLNYIMHYPTLEKYISLYRSGEDGATNRKRERIRKDVERRMEEGTLERGDALSIKNAKDGFGDPGVVKKEAKKQAVSGKGSKSKSEVPIDDEMEDGGSDGGFFET